MSANDDLLSPRLTGAEYFARVNALDQKAALLSVWADLFTDNCSEQGADELYAHYTTFAGLFSGHRGGQALPFREFQAFVGENSPMGFHDGEDTDQLIYRLAVAHRYQYPG